MTKDNKVKEAKPLIKEDEKTEKINSKKILNKISIRILDFYFF